MGPVGLPVGRMYTEATRGPLAACGVTNLKNWYLQTNQLVDYHRGRRTTSRGHPRPLMRDGVRSRSFISRTAPYAFHDYCVMDDVLRHGHVPGYWSRRGRPVVPTTERCSAQVSSSIKPGRGVRNPERPGRRFALNLIATGSARCSVSTTRRCLTTTPRQRRAGEHPEPYAVPEGLSLTFGKD